MGLDWNPGNKPKPGYEAEFDEILDRIESRDFAEKPAGLARLFPFVQARRSKGKPTRDELLERFDEISTTAFETLNAPRVGHDEEANRWAEENYNKEKFGKTKEEWLKYLNGFYVLSLVDQCDGLPRYSNGSPGAYVEPYSFRAEFLKDCVEILGYDLIDFLYQTRKSDDMADFGQQLQSAAEEYAREEGRDLDELEIDGVDQNLDIVLSAARWCKFWGERGHFLDPYF